MSERVWDHECSGPGAIAQTDQIRQDMINIVRDAPVIFLVAAKPTVSGCAIRALCALPAEMTEDERTAFMLRYFQTARDELDTLIEKLESGEAGA